MMRMSSPFKKTIFVEIHKQLKKNAIQENLEFGEILILVSFRNDLFIHLLKVVIPFFCGTSSFITNIFLCKLKKKWF